MASNSKMHILLTGASGILGTEIVPVLEKQILNGALHLFTEDIRDADKVKLFLIRLQNLLTWFTQRQLCPSKP